MTEQARLAVCHPKIELRVFPFRVGRESRAHRPALPADAPDRRRPDSLPVNDLYVREEGTTVNVSKQHFLIDRDGEGFVLVDRGSRLGTIVNGERVGGSRAGGRAALRSGDVIVIGSASSRCVLQFLVR